MQGYAERFDFESQTITGWVFDAEADYNRDVRVVATFDGDIVGEASPSTSRRDLLKITSQDTAFSLRCSRAFTALDLASGRLLVKATCGDRETVMRFTVDGHTALKKMAIEELNGISAPALWSRADRDAVKPQVEAGNLSPMLLPAGLPSLDGSAVIGLRGHLFLTEGSNALLSLYKTPSPDVLTSRVDGWVDVFTRRQERCEARGIRYVQTIIPEKLTVLRADAPLPIDGPSPVLQGIETRLRESSFYVSGLTPFEQWDATDDPFLMTDTHLTATGAQRVFADLAAYIDPQLVPIINAVRIDQVRYAIGDLTDRFGIPSHSRIIEPSDAEIAAYGEGLTQVEEYLPPEGGFKGQRHSWTNNTAPSALKLLVFGNSFFGRGTFAGSLSWWAKHFFSEVHFCWMPEFDWSLVDELQPDVVLGQTVERFLPVTPKA